MISPIATRGTRADASGRGAGTGNAGVGPVVAAPVGATDAVEGDRTDGEDEADGVDEGTDGNRGTGAVEVGRADGEVTTAPERIVVPAVGTNAGVTAEVVAAADASRDAAQATVGVPRTTTATRATRSERRHRRPPIGWGIGTNSPRLESPAAHASGRAAAIVAMGLHPPLPRGSGAQLTALLHEDPDGRVRSAALATLVRVCGARRAVSAWRIAIRDADTSVRRRAAELAPAVVGSVTAGLLALLSDDDPVVAETAAWACGEVATPPRASTRLVRALRDAATHDDALVREAAIAALGARGDVRGLPAILAGCRDRPAVRRRAVLALAPFDGPEVDSALARALGDADWQVRQAAEDLLGTHPDESTDRGGPPEGPRSETRRDA